MNEHRHHLVANQFITYQDVGFLVPVAAAWLFEAVSMSRDVPQHHLAVVAAATDYVGIRRGELEAVYIIRSLQQ